MLIVFTCRIGERAVRGIQVHMWQFHVQEQNNLCWLSSSLEQDRGERRGHEISGYQETRWTASWKWQRFECGYCFSSLINKRVCHIPENDWLKWKINLLLLTLSRPNYIMFVLYFVEIQYFIQFKIETCHLWISLMSNVIYVNLYINIHYIVLQSNSWPLCY